MLNGVFVIRIVDDMFVLLKAFKQSNEMLDVSDRISYTMKHAGVSICFTSITDLTAFFITAFFMPFEKSFIFCIYTGTGIIIDFLFQISLFIALITIFTSYNITSITTIPVRLINQINANIFVIILDKSNNQVDSNTNSNIKIPKSPQPPTAPTASPQPPISLRSIQNNKQIDVITKNVKIYILH